ncbi:hypothetical protein HPP92_012738 [Vanilla planifolia]|uniref:Uncharacterized protein n=1 Tax=Vanilla planifolia TaxID=51239 RepID=A0A835QXE5_VANPL|nr:hypothetical protein HPP92_012738 [Vanilla planifolia]
MSLLCCPFLSRTIRSICLMQVAHQLMEVISGDVFAIGFSCRLLHSRALPALLCVNPVRSNLRFISRSLKSSGSGFRSYSPLSSPTPCDGGESKENSLSIFIREDGKLAMWSCFRTDKCGWKGRIERTLFFRFREWRGVTVYQNGGSSFVFKSQSHRTITETDFDLEPLCPEIVIAFTYRRNGKLVSCKYRTTDKKFWQVRVFGVNDDIMMHHVDDEALVRKATHPRWVGRVVGVGGTIDFHLTLTAELACSVGYSKVCVWDWGTLYKDLDRFLYWLYLVVDKKKVLNWGLKYKEEDILASLLLSILTLITNYLEALVTEHEQEEGCGFWPVGPPKPYLVQTRQHQLAKENISKFLGEGPSVPCIDLGITITLNVI